MNPVLNLFMTFLKIGLLSIGGGYAVIPSIQEQVVERAGLISEKMFADIITISQMTPGPLAVNTSTFVGLLTGGIPGAVAATVGCVLCGVLISLLLFRFFQKHSGSACVTEILNGLRSASLGLIVSAAVTILSLTLFGTQTLDADSISSFNVPALLLFAAALVLARRKKFSPILIMVMSGIAGLIFYLPGMS